MYVYVYIYIYVCIHVIHNNILRGCIERVGGASELGARPVAAGRTVSFQNFIITYTYYHCYHHRCYHYDDG